jgi:hypothetical protein
VNLWIDPLKALGSLLRQRRYRRRLARANLAAASVPGLNRRSRE